MWIQRISSNYNPFTIRNLGMTTKPIAPDRICAQIGQRKRYFDTREEAIAALQAFTDKQLIRAKPADPSQTHNYITDDMANENGMLKPEYQR